MEVVLEWLPMAAMPGVGWRWAVRFEDRVDRRLASHGERIAHIEGQLERRAD